jgi:2,3-bisphosphoglycerate-independent phosphoglycerate mutase
MFFIDGLGIGGKDPQKNPMACTSTRWFEFFSQEESQPTGPCRLIRPTDVTLGVEGIPQSATGQTTLLTGLHAARLVGRHVNGFCTRELGGLLNGNSLFSQLLKRNKKPTFANAYTPPFFEGKMRFRSVTTVAVSQAGLPFRSLKDLIAGKALYQDFTNRILRDRGYEVPQLTPQEAGRRLASIASGYDFTLYEYFQTDIAGHSQEMERCREEVKKVDLFVDSILTHLDLDSTLFLLTSDHGNIEDLSTPGHTSNRVPTILWGRGKEALGSRIKSIADLTPGIIGILDQDTRRETFVHEPKDLHPSSLC